MLKELEYIEHVSDWGFIQTDVQGHVSYVSPTFCNNFLCKEEDLKSISIDAIIHRSKAKKNKTNEIFFGLIFGYSCLIKTIAENNLQIYQVILRQEDAEPSEIASFLNSINSKQYKKRSINKIRYSFEEIIGESASILRVKELAAKIATNNSTILLTGESGTGKELFAQAIHDVSSRVNHSFIAVNCVAIPDELFESELFGYEAGAFSGAKKEGKPGKIELAQNGTLFLDEISELSYQSQGKLLRVLQEREVERLGSTKSRQVDIRIIAATNRDLKSLVEEGKFRQDLFYRLYVFDLQIPPLRKRQGDIVQLAYSFVDYYNERFGKEVNFIDSLLEDWLISYHWPGNVRELKACIERGMNIVDDDTLTMNHLFFSSEEPINSDSSQPTKIDSLAEEVVKAETNAIQQVLKETNGDRSLAAQKLKIHVASLYRKITKYNIK